RNPFNHPPRSGAGRPDRSSARQPLSRPRVSGNTDGVDRPRTRGSEAPVPSPIPSARTILRLAATAAAVLVAGSTVRAQPAGSDPTDVRQSDEELRRRLAPLAPMVRESLAGKDRDAQRAALGIAADFPRDMANNARLPAA